MRLLLDLKKLFNNRKKIKTLKFLNSLHNSNLAKYQNIAIFANDKIGAEVSVHGIYEKNLILFLQKCLPKIIDTKNSIAIDVGANIGNHAIFFSSYFYKVYAFEAHPEIFEILRFNTRNNKNINVFNIALFNKIEKMFIISDQIANYGASYISKNFCPQSQQNTFELETKVFSDIFPNLNIKKKISFIKLDVEGVEQEVLQGFKNILSADSPVICFEQHLNEFKNENNQLTTKTIKFLREFDYNYFMR